MDVKRKKEIINKFNSLKLVELFSLKLSKDLNLKYEDVYERISKNIESKIEKDLDTLSSAEKLKIKNNKSTEEFISEKPVIKG